MSGSIFSNHTGCLQDPSTEGWVAANAERLRALPLAAGASGIIGVLLNRLLSGVSLLYVHVLVHMCKEELTKQVLEPADMPCLCAHAGCSCS